METVVRETLIQHGVEPSDASFDACFNRLSTITETFVRVCLSRVFTSQTRLIGRVTAHQHS